MHTTPSHETPPIIRARRWTAAKWVVSGVSLVAVVALASAKGQAAEAPEGKKPVQVKIPKVKAAPKKKKITVKPKPKAPTGDVSLPPEFRCTIKTSDIIHPNIDIGAQLSLMRKMSGDFHSAQEASSIIRAVHDQRLAGVLLPPRKAVSDRGQRMTPKKGHWELIPSGKTSTCLLQPTGEPPMMLYRTDMSPPQIDEALTLAWLGCGLPNLPEPCDYVVDLHKPEVECKTDMDCLKKALGNYCNVDTETCGIKFPDNYVPGRVCAFPRCNSAVPAEADWACGSVSTDVARQCIPIPGETCGICQGVTDKAQKCHQANESRHKAELKACRKDYHPAKVGKYAIECTTHMLKCEVHPFKNAKSCYESAKCFVSPQPHNEYIQCVNRESTRYWGETTKCDQL